MEHKTRIGKSLNLHRSQDLFEEAQQLIPGGVNSPVRAFRGVGGNPVFIDRANGIRRQWIDYWETTTGHRASMTASPR